MRPKEAMAASQKFPVAARAANDRTTDNGEGSSRSRPTQRAASCHTPSQMAGGMMIFCSFLIGSGDIVDGVIRQRTAH